MRVLTAGCVMFSFFGRRDEAAGRGHREIIASKTDIHPFGDAARFPTDV